MVDSAPTPLRQEPSLQRRKGSRVLLATGGSPGVLRYGRVGAPGRARRVHTSRFVGKYAAIMPTMRYNQEMLDARARRLGG